ncbi:protein masquerade [Nephila pilipes]|uniref:Protein masquerade n=1 Tax=Nephila pilipes TaxID=299642 RepID=A0A8X6MXP2_NEPPI|nr:protein masquerade [Nephila pilipes]
MVSLPGFVFYFLLLFKTCWGSEPITTFTTEAVTIPFECPGSCVPENDCKVFLNDTACAEADLVCCVEFKTVSSTEDSYLGYTTLGAVDVETASEFLPQGDDSESSFEDVDVEDTRYILYPDSFNPESNVEDKSETYFCPGACIPDVLIQECDYIMKAPGICTSDTTCCVTKGYALAVYNEHTNELEDEESVHVKRAVPSMQEYCPGTCVHPSHSMFCEQILPQFICPLNSKCCIKRSSDKESTASAVLECTGQCLPQNMLGYCFPPNELILGATTCKRGTTCCMVRSTEALVQPPSLYRMQFPDPNESSKRPQMVLGHLAVDDAGTVFRVNTNGQIYRLPRLNNNNLKRMQLKKLITYPLPAGAVAIYSDSEGGLYQHLLPRVAHPPTFVPKTPVEQQEQSESDSKLGTESKDEIQEDIVIPDDNDEPPVETNTPVVYDGKTSRPACPGSCMSYFLRFTCFRGYATYDGFACPGKSVCCARLKDIEDHEEYLKSLSPYFKDPPTSTEKVLHGCGIKGRRDTPRVVGGKEALPGEWCWQVAIINVQNQYICGGALIGDSWVLTAAHCVVGPTNENQAIFVRVGVTDLKSTEDNNKGQTIRVMSTFIHHNFNTINLDNNIALLRLQKPVKLNGNVCVVCLPTSGKMPQGSIKCTVTGYGFVSMDGDMSLKIGEAQVPIIDDTECMTNVTEALANPFILPASSFCAGGQGQQDSCQGDAGGPLVCEIGGFHELVGLVSWSLGCGREDVPSIYIKVPAFMGWINQIISSSSFLMSLS